jgi:hypothetical protein
VDEPNREVEMEAELQVRSDEYSRLDTEVRLIGMGFLAALEAYGMRQDADEIRHMLSNQMYRELANRMLTLRIQGR